MPAPRKSPAKRGASLFRPAVAFASLFALALLGIWNWQHDSLNTTPYQQQFTAALGQQKTLTLIDGSVVNLNSNSQLLVYFNHEARNLWLLQGQAHFEVQKDPARPFNVFVSNSRVQAVGTAFSVEIAAQQLEVLVTEGRISLAFAEGAPSESSSTHHSVVPQLPQQTAMSEVTLMEAGDYLKIGDSLNLKQAQRFASSNKRKLTAQALRAQQAWRKGELVFQGETLLEVIEELKRYSPLQFVIETPELETLRIGGRAKIDQIDSFLASLELNFGLRIEQTAPHQFTITRSQN